MNYWNMEEVIEEAFDNGEVVELLKGEKDYSLPVPDLPVDVPTDWTRLIPSGIHNLYRNRQEECVKKQFESAVLSLCAGNPEELWISAYVLYTQLDTESRDEAAFALDRKLLILFTRSVYACAAFLENSRYHSEDISMYEDIKRLDTILREDYGIRLLADDSISNLMNNT